LRLADDQLSVRARGGGRDAIDDRYAELQFRLGRVYLELAKFSEAKKCFVSARDLDTLRQVKRLIDYIAAHHVDGVLGFELEFVNLLGVD
jgi:hypothetical protein